MPILKWWQTAIFYQIYPRSFYDSNGDGIGDLPGIIQHLDYLKDLGIDAIWLSPHFPSPQFDCGYDITDYTGVDPAYGTLGDFRYFLDEAHRHDIRLILDLVLNHTSHEHPWFLESRSSLDNPKRDWYLWRDGKDGEPPNNWYASFGGSAWEYDPLTGQYYYHFFFKEQPDLNWRNPGVKQAIFDAVRFWLDMGVDGFRLDAIGTIFEDPQLPNQTASLTLAELRNALDHAASPEEQASLREQFRLMFKHQIDQPGLHTLMKDLRRVMDEYDDRLLVGESENIAYHGNGDDELHLVFNFPLMRTHRLTPPHVRMNQAERLAELGSISPDSWPCNTLGNHDSPRVYSQFGDGIHNDQIARLSLALLLTLKGTPFLYNGEEIGMTDLLLQDINQFRDLLGIWRYHADIEQLGLPPEKALEHAAIFTRDKNRTPFQWRNAPNAGFSPPGIPTWLPVNPNYALGVNVADQDPDPSALLNFYRQLLHLRKQIPALVYGEYLPLHETALDYLAFLRQTETQICLVILNFSPRTHLLDFHHLGKTSARRIFSNIARGKGPEMLSALAIAPYEILILELSS